MAPTYRHGVLNRQLYPHLCFDTQLASIENLINPVLGDNGCGARVGLGAMVAGEAVWVVLYVAVVGPGVWVG